MDMPDNVHDDGGSATDRTRILEVHQAYLDANSTFDWKALRPIWSDDPTNVFFNMNGHTYLGLEHWTRLWQYYGERLETGQWEPFDVKVIVCGDMAVVTCHRKTKTRWTGAPTERPVWHVDKSFTSRSTMVLLKQHGDWKTVHVHFSEARDTPRPGNI
jgi:hypothetical protein